MTQKKRLKRGLDHLISTTSLALDDPIAAERSHVASAEFMQLPVEQIQPGKYQPRKEMNLNALEDLANSIRVQGVIQPIVVRPIGEQQYELIAGERRWRATQIAGLDKIPAIIKSVNDQRTMVMALIENIQREDLNPIEEAQALQALIDDHALTHQQVAEAVGKSRATVTNLLRLMSLEADVKPLIVSGDLSLGHAKVLLSLEGEQQYQAALQVVDKKLSVRETEQLIFILLSERPMQIKRRAKKDPDVILLERRLSDLLRVDVKVKHSTSGKGRLIIQYNNLKELDDILHHIE